MRRMLRNAYQRLMASEHEARVVESFVKMGLSRRSGGRGRVLDVGCGYGRYLRRLAGLGLDVTGVDANPTIVATNRSAGLRCISPSELGDERFDVVLMSHVIEHFSPEPLLTFVDTYLDRIDEGGALVIATPLLSPYFYDDFDHVKPYHPLSLMMVFGPGAAQVRFYARNRVTLEDLWIRSSPLRSGPRRGRHLPGGERRLLQLADVASAIAFHATFRLVGRKDGWVGLFRKSATAAPSA